MVRHGIEAEQRQAKPAAALERTVARPGIAARLGKHRHDIASELKAIVACPDSRRFGHRHQHHQ
jgi:hypothetical protein